MLFHCHSRVQALRFVPILSRVPVVCFSSYWDFIGLDCWPSTKPSSFHILDLLPGNGGVIVRSTQSQLPVLEIVSMI